VHQPKKNNPMKKRTTRLNQPFTFGIRL